MLSLDEVATRKIVLGMSENLFFSLSVPSNKIKFGLRIIYIDTYILPTCLLKVIFGWPSKTYGIGCVAV